jgi:hypothetical protein
MTRDQLEHAIRAACEIADDTDKQKKSVMRWIQITAAELGIDIW